MPNTLKEIGEYTFDNCTYLKEIEIPDRTIVNDILSARINIREIHGLPKRFSTHDAKMVINKYNERRY